MVKKQNVLSRAHDIKMKTTLIVPCLNEYSNLVEIMPQIKREWVDQIIILDGNSTDGTLQYCSKQGYELFVQKSKGLWDGYTELFESGLVKGDCIITFSPDGNSIPDVIPELIDKIKHGYDLVIASRYKNPAVSLDDTKITRFGNWLFTNMINLLYWTKYTDALVIYRAYRKSLVKKLKLTQSVGMYDWLQRNVGLTSWEVPMAIRARKRDLYIAEISASEPKRIGGVKNTSVLKTGLIILMQIIKERL
jgi:glycosyltransferase involved in cell wall biosynthesis